MRRVRAFLLTVLGSSLLAVLGSSLLAVLGSSLLAPAASAAGPTPPRYVLRQARDQLRATSNGGAAAYRALGPATAPMVWVDASNAVAPPSGKAVFAGSRVALLDLEPLLNTSSPPAAVATAEGLILTADRRLAEDAIQQAAGGLGLLARAKGMVISGDRWAATSRVDLAAEQYGAAWVDAFDALTPLVVTPVTNVPSGALGDAAGNALAAHRIAFASVRVVRNQPPLTPAGKPEVLLVGSDKCAACAFESWGMAVALSQFGTFTNLHLSQSTTTRRPVVRGLTFAGASYGSPFVTFAIAKPSSKVPLPSVDVANKFADVGSPASPRVAGRLFWRKIAGSLSQPTTSSGQAIDGTAELLTAEICEVTGGVPAAVCGTAAVQAYQNRLPPASP